MVRKNFPPIDIGDGGPNPPGDNLTRTPPTDVPILGDNPWLSAQQGPTLKTQPYKQACQRLLTDLGDYLGISEPDHTGQGTGALGAGKSHLPHRIAQQTPHGLMPSLTLSGCSAYLPAAPR